MSKELNSATALVSSPPLFGDPGGKAWARRVPCPTQLAQAP